MKKNAFLARVVEFFFVKFFQDVAYGVGSMVEGILRWADGECGGTPKGKISNFLKILLTIVQYFSYLYSTIVGGLLAFFPKLKNLARRDCL